jgi:hypothetical protein
MDKHIKYLDLFGDEISSEQKNTLERYQIAYFADEKLEKAELYENGELISTRYIVYDFNEISFILKKDRNASFNLLYTDNGYRISEGLSFKNQLLTIKQVYVLDKHEHVICFRDYTLDEEGKPIGVHTEKFFYEEGEHRYVFEYNQDGTCLVIHDEKYLENIWGSCIGDASTTDFTWKGFEYYQFSDPLIPNNHG